MPIDRGVTPGPTTLIDARELAAMLGVTTATIRRRNSEGAIPKPIEVDGEIRWHKHEIRRWIGAGLPSRETWEADPTSTCIPTIINPD